MNETNAGVRYRPREGKRKNTTIKPLAYFARIKGVMAAGCGCNYHYGDYTITRRRKSLIDPMELWETLIRSDWRPLKKRFSRKSNRQSKQVSETSTD